MPKDPGRFCSACPLKLSKTPTEPCPKALERIHAQQTDNGRIKADPDTLPGCPWAVNSSENHYCFWVLAKDLDDSIPDREICNLLGISQQSLEKTLQSAIVKLQAQRGTEAMDGFIEAVMEKASAQNPDNTVYLPDSFASPPETLQPGGDEDGDPDAKLVAEETKKPRKNLGMPMHRDGSKVDIFGLYSRKKLEEMRRNKK